MADTKVCRKCGVEKPVAEFHRRATNRDGLYSYCKPCTIAATQRWASGRKELKREYDRARVQRLKPILQAKDRARYERTREKRIATAAAWAANNREKRRLISQSYKHRRRAAERDGIGWKELRDWKASQPKACHWCGIKCADSYEVDHIIPLAKGGEHKARNLCISCRSCNARKSARDPIEFAQSIGKLL